jgi:hypothetical protein
VLILFWGPALAAQSEDQLAEARQLYSQGLTQEAAGDWAGALASFQAVARIKMTAQVRFHIARSKEHLGRLNEALGGYRLAEYEATQAGAEEALLNEIRSARDSLAKRIPKLVIERGAIGDATKIELDGVVIGESQIGREVSVDPGPHAVVGILPNGKRFERTVTVKEGMTELVVLRVPEELESGGGDEARVQDATPTTDARPAEQVESSSLPWVVGSIGVASLAASGVFYLLRNDAEAELDRECLGRICPDTVESTQERGERYALLSGVTLGIGIVGVGTAVVMLLGRSGGDAAPTQQGWSVRVVPSRSAGSVAVGGRF